jgi:phage terminase small subunit
MIEQLSERERRFVHAYCGEAAGNGAKAAVLAGYSPNGAKVTANRLLTRHNVRDAVQAFQQQVVTASALSAEQWHAEVDAILAPIAKTVTTGEKLKALELSGKAKGYVRDKPQDGRITVNIGFLSVQGDQQTTFDVKPMEVTPQPRVALPGESERDRRH